MKAVNVVSPSMLNFEFLLQCRALVWWDLKCIKQLKSCSNISSCSYLLFSQLFIPQAPKLVSALLTEAMFRFQNAKYKIFINRLHAILNVVKKINRITPMDCKSRDESNEPN